jgi:ribonuclease P protein component
MTFEMGTCCRVKKEGFSKSIRVKKPIDCQRIIVDGYKKKSKNLVIYRLRGQDGQKFGIKIPGDIRKAAHRNKIKRVIREFLRKSKDRFAEDEGVVVVCRSAAGAVDIDKVRGELASLIRQESGT